MIDFKVYVDQICNSSCLFVTKLLFPFELSAAGAKRGVRSLPMRTVPSRRSTLAQPAEGRPGPSDDDDDYHRAEAVLSALVITYWANFVKEG